MWLCGYVAKFQKIEVSNVQIPISELQVSNSKDFEISKSQNLKNPKIQRRSKAMNF